jgi:hypothetical protein
MYAHFNRGDAPVLVCRGSAGENTINVADEHQAVALPGGAYLEAEERRYLRERWVPPEQSNYHVFLSYRWGNGDFDRRMADALYEALSTVPLHVFLDRQKLHQGESFVTAFMDAMHKSSVIVPLVSWGALMRMTALTEHSPRDNLLVEWALALELVERSGKRVKINPVLMGPQV